jgi:hypothetical protein
VLAAQQVVREIKTPKQIEACAADADGRDQVMTHLLLWITFADVRLRNRSEFYLKVSTRMA